MTEKVRFENILEAVGNRGKFQILVGTAIILVGLFTVFQNILVIVVFYTPEHWCNIPGRLTEQNESWSGVSGFLDWTEEDDDRIGKHAISKVAWSQFTACHLYLHNYSRDLGPRWSPEDDDQSQRQSQEVVSCGSWTYETKEFQSTLVTEWNLVCDSQSMASVARFAHQIGTVLGCLSWGFFSDRYGRRNCALAGIFIFVVGGILASFSIHYAVFVVLRVVIGIGCAGASSSLYVLLAEAVDLKIRGVIQMAYLSIFSFAMMALSPMALYINDWSTLSLTISSCSVLLAATYWLVPESARWYIIKGKFEDAYSTLQHVANVNGRAIDKDLLMQMIADCNRSEMRSAEVLDQKATFKIFTDLFQSELRRKTVLMYFLWSITASIFEVMKVHSPVFGDNIFTTIFLSGATEVPSYILGVILIRYLCRRMAIVGCFIVCGLVAMSSLLIPDDLNWVIVWNAFICKSAITISYSLIYVFTMEVFPTRHRHLALGTGSTCARIGAGIGYLYTRSSLSVPILLAIFGGQAILASFACLWLPETKLKALPETIVDTLHDSSLRDD